MSDKDNKVKKTYQKPNENQGVLMEGHIKISDPETKKILVDKRNAIHYENMSISLAESLGNEGRGNIVERFAARASDIQRARTRAVALCQRQGVVLFV